MYNLNAERAMALMQTMLCTNGNCPQENCLLRHLGPPLINTGGVGILDRAETADGRSGVAATQNVVDNDDEEIMLKVLEESRRLAYTCRYYGMVMSDEDSFQ